MFVYKNVNVNYEYINNNSDNTLVFLHGWGQNIQMMEPISDHFKSKQNILLIDFPGHGKSEEPKEAWDLIDFVELVHELISNLNINNVILIGHSFGGKVSIMYASRYKVKKLVLLSSPYKVEIKKQPLKIKILKKFKKIPILNKLADSIKKHMGSTDYRNATPVMRQILVKHVNTDATEDVRKITVPTIIIWGTNDVTVDIENAYEIESLLKDGAVISYEGGTHFAYLENKVKTVNIIKSFIE